MSTTLKRFFNPHFDRKEGELYGAGEYTYIIENGKPVIWDSFYCARKHYEFEQWALKNAPFSVRIVRERAKKQSARKALRRQRKKLYLRTGS